MTGEEARRLVEAGARLLDVRTAGEYRAGHLPGAVHIPLQELERRMKEAGPRDGTVVAYCLSGARSAHAKRLLLAHGFTRVHDLGAMSRW